MGKNKLKREKDTRKKLCKKEITIYNKWTWRALNISEIVSGGERGAREQNVNVTGIICKNVRIFPFHHRKRMSIGNTYIL